jgi:hypothetical protein
MTDRCERFLKTYCERCWRRPRLFGDDGVTECIIMEDALRVGDPEEPGYPIEWVFDSHGRPTCRAFMKA